MAAANNLEYLKMNKIKSLGLIIAILIIILVLVITRTSNQNLFKQDSKNAIEAMTKSSNLISMAELKKLSTQYLVVNLNNTDNYNSTQFQNSKNIPFESILDKANRKVLNEAEGKIVLYSDDISIASKTWVILNQLNYSNVYILHSEENTEVFKYKFQPDTTAKLE